MFASRGTTATRLILLATVLAAFGLRLFRLDAQSLWYDEGVTALVGRMDAGALVRWTAADIQPPLYYLIVHVWGWLAGWSEWSLRFVSVWFGLLVVPLFIVLTRRFRPMAAVTITAALLAALHPLLVYYSQEARMYAPLTALALLLGYALLRYGGDGRARPWLITYALAGIAAVYTHYFAFFLLLALGIAWLLDRRHSAHTGGGGAAPGRPVLVANGAIVVAYLPWFWVMFTRLAVDNSYWQGSLKLAEALHKVAITFATGETVAEQQALWLLTIYALVTLLAVGRLWRGGAAGRRVLSWAGIWLLVPVLGVLVLASRAPKFNPRYVMVALPGLLLIWAVGLAPVGGAGTRRAGRLLTGGGMTLLLLGFVYANVNWFTDLAFRKDQWREVTADLRAKVGPEEGIVLVSGHAWPVWQYYAPDLPVVRLPDLATLDVDAVLDFADTAPPLQDALRPLADRPGAWLVLWQDEVVDPMGVVPIQFELAGREKGMDARYWGIDLRRYSQLKVDWFADTPPIETPVATTFYAGGAPIVTLLGYNSLDNGDLALFWQLADSSAAAAADLFIAGTTTDPVGAPVAAIEDRRSAGYTFPSFRWGPDRVAMTHLRATDWLGPAPQQGAYTVDLRTYDGTARTPAPLTTADGADAVLLGPIEVIID